MTYPQRTFPSTEVYPSSLVGRRREAVRSNTLLYQLNVLKNTGRYDAFKLERKPIYEEASTSWPIPKHLFWDSDVAKWIEGACYFLQQHPNAEVDAAVKEIVGWIRSAQQPDGYLNIHYTVVEPGLRWTNLRDFHELYNAGHLIEAALAHQDCYKNDLLLEPLVKYVNLLCTVFGSGPGQIPGYPGHPEIELALIRLHAHTKDPRHFALAQFFITERGNPTGCFGRHFYDVEAERRHEDPNKLQHPWPEPRSLWYHQAHVPIVDQKTIEGHSVRAMYLLTAAADLVLSDRHNTEMENAVQRLWDNMVNCKMYVTGGIGAMEKWEGFGKEYFLPQGTDEGGCYSETCAAIGVMMFAERLLQRKLDGRYGDVMELCLYNAVLTSMSHDGKQFTYVNQLASSDANLSQRAEWFTCACCPPNVLRLFGQIGGYIWTHRIEDDSAEIAVHLYIASKLKFDVGSKPVELVQEGNWPWDSEIKFQLQTSVPTILKLRIPGWASSYTASPPQPHHWSLTPTNDHQLSPACPDAKVHKGYLTLPPTWLSSHPEFSLSMPLSHRLIASHPLTGQNTLSLARGPIVYCIEDVDNAWTNDHFRMVTLRDDAKIESHNVKDETTGDEFVGLTVTEGAGLVEPAQTGGMPWIDASKGGWEVIEKLEFVPYYFRANRGGKGFMRVGLKRA